MGRPCLLVKARPTTASSIEARQHSGAETRIEYTHALQDTGREGEREFKNKRTSFLLLAGDRCLKESNVKMLFSRRAPA